MNRKHVLQFKRKRKKQTNYRRRLKLVISGKPRLVIRKSLKYLLAGFDAAGFIFSKLIRS